MIKELFTDSEFTFNEWIILYKWEYFFINVFKHDYTLLSNERKKNLILNAFNKM